MQLANGRRMRRVLPLVPLVVVVLACGGRTPISQRGDGGPVITACSAVDPPICVAAGEDPCGPPRAITAACDESTRKWSCPAGSITRTPNPTGVCRPFHDGTFTSLGALVRVPTEDGRCLWIAESATKKGDLARPNVAFDPGDDALASRCPQKPDVLGEIVDLDEPNPSDFVVELLGGVRFAGQVRVIYRLFRKDANAPLGVTELGGGFASWKAERIVVPKAANLLWGPDLSLGDATLATSDYLYLWGCPPPVDFLTEKCLLARFDASSSMELYQVDGTWSKSTAQASAARLFGAGPWLGSVIPASGGFLHLHAVGFGTAIDSHRSPAVNGPWSAYPSRPCDLPASDPKAYCAGPVIHSEMMSPGKTDVLVVSYGVGTTSPNRASLYPDDYWPRLAWITAP